MRRMKRLAAKAASLALVMSLGFGTEVSASAEKVETGFAPTTDTYLVALANAENVTREIAEEGMILLKNNGALPMNVAEGCKITVLGRNSVEPVYGGSGSAGGGMPKVDVYNSLWKAGFTVNPVMEAFYRDAEKSSSARPATPAQGSMPSGYAVAETPMERYTDAEKQSCADYADAALVFISRIGGEGYDLPTTSYLVDEEGNETVVPGRNDASEHYLELDQNEKDLIAFAKENFDKVVIVLNAGTPLELGSVQADEGVDAILWAGCPGVTGFEALGEILNGTVNPSGRTVDTYAADFTASPAWQNFAVNAENGRADAANNTLVLENGEATKYHMVEYEEGIYVGYRYYETRGFSDGEEWYAENVVYPFGYGLSYTTFQWNAKFPENAVISRDTKIDVEVTVTNTGSVAGKDVVELYASTPYLAGEIEKAHVVLAGFAKTKLLAPGESETVTITVDPYTMASYDYNDANLNDFCGYELDPGTYTLYVGTNAHDAWTNGAAGTFTLDESILYETDPVTGNAVENRFDEVSEHFEDGNAVRLSRSDWEDSFPTYMDEDDLVIDEETFDKLEMTVVDAAFDEDQPWYTDVMPVQADPIELAEGETAPAAPIQFAELIGLDREDPKWTAFMDQFTIAELGAMMSGNYSIPGIERLGIPVTHAVDGPVGFVYQMGEKFGVTGVFYAAPVMVAATWNTDLAAKEGDCLAEEGLWTHCTGIYGPATNMHRTPFSGRNFEYYSEDGFLAGKICASVVKSMTDKGLITFVKHFALNDQETNRDTLAGLVTYADEQTIREIYLKPFEMAVKEGSTKAIMSAFNRIGLTNCSENYGLLTDILRNEWGFEGTVVTDFGGSMTQYANPDALIRVGNNLWLGNLGADALTLSGEGLTATQVAALRKAAQESLYVVANSSEMNFYESYWNEFSVDGGNPWIGNFKVFGKVIVGDVERGQEINLDMSSKIHGTDGEVTYEALNLPLGLSIDPQTGILSGTIAEKALDGYYMGLINLRNAEGKSIGEQVRVIMFLQDTSEKPADFAYISELTYAGEQEAEIRAGEQANICIAVNGGVDGKIVVVPGAWGAVNYYNTVEKPVLYTVTGGELPAGLWISPAGSICGVTTQTGDYTVEVTAASQEVDASLTTAVTIHVLP